MTSLAFRSVAVPLSPQGLGDLVALRMASPPKRMVDIPLRLLEGWMHAPLARTRGGDTQCKPVCAISDACDHTAGLALQ
eukprot:12181772-Alexandrium_andersonii.AAC.1